MHRGDVSSFCFPVSLSILILFILLALYTPNGCDFPFSQHEKEKLFFFFSVKQQIAVSVYFASKAFFFLFDFYHLIVVFFVLFLFLIFSLVRFLAETKSNTHVKSGNVFHRKCT